MSDTKATPLNYAPPAMRLRPWLRRGLLLVWAALTVYLAHDKWGLGLRLQVRMLQTQRQALRFVQPPDQIVYGGDAVPYGAERQIADLDEALTDLAWWDQRQAPRSLWTDGMADGDHMFTELGSRLEEDFYVFLHERRAPMGEARLVGVRACAFDDTELGLEADVFSVAGPFERPKRLGAARIPFDVGTFTLSSSAPGTLRLFAPQPDPADASRFTFVYENGVERGTVEGRLKPDDSVEFTLLPGATPLTQPAAPVQP